MFRRLAFVVALLFCVVWVASAALPSPQPVADPMDSNETVRYGNIWLRNPSYSPVDVFIAGRRPGVHDRRMNIPGDATVSVEDGYLYGGWRVVCWWDHNNPGAEPKVKKVYVNRGNFTIELREP